MVCLQPQSAWTNDRTRAFRFSAMDAGRRRYAAELSAQRTQRNSDRHPDEPDRNCRPFTCQRDASNFEKNQAETITNGLKAGKWKGTPRRPWTPERDKELRDLVFSACATGIIAKALNRTTFAVPRRASALRLPLRQIAKASQTDLTLRS